VFAEKERGKFFYGWVIVMAVWLAMFVGAAANTSFSIFGPELEDEFGWTRGALSLGFTLNVIVMSIFGLVAGILVDRIGPKRTVIIGAVIGSLGVVLLSQVNQIWHFYIFYGVIASIGLALAYMVPTIATVRRWFMRRAALALAIALTGSGLGIVLLLPGVNLMIDAFGWRTGYFGLGLIALVGLLIAAMLLKRDPESAGTYPDGIEPDPDELETRADFSARTEQWSIGEAVRTRSWWFLIGAQLYDIALIGILAHLIFWAEDMNISRDTAVTILSLYVLAAVFGRLFAGYFSDWYMARFKVSRKPMLYFCTIGVGLGCFLALGVGSATSLLLVCLLIGFCYGTGMTVFPTYLGDLFGVVNIPTLFGVMGLFVGGLFASIGPVLYGFIHDATESYDVAFLIAGILCLVSAVSLLMIKVPVKRKAVTS
jgi:OFA family oxalate/formate antiporter-like MFS transporter